MNDSLLRDTCEASALAFGLPGEPRSAGTAATLEFIEHPTARTWYRAHNVTIASGYLANEELARAEDRVERFFLNLVLVRVLFAHAMVAEPRLALGWLSPLGRGLGDPRLGMTSIFLSLSRVLPDEYPLGDDLDAYVSAENSIGHLLDVGVIVPRLGQLYELVRRRARPPGPRRPARAAGVDPRLRLGPAGVGRLAPGAVVARPVGATRATRGVPGDRST